MKCTKRLLCLLLCLVTCIALALPAMAAYPATWDEAAAKMSIDETLSDYNNVVEERYKLYYEDWDWETDVDTVVAEENGDCVRYNVIPSDGSITIRATGEGSDYYIRVVLRIYEKDGNGKYVARTTHNASQGYDLRNGGFEHRAASGYAEDGVPFEGQYKYLYSGQSVTISAAELIEHALEHRGYTPKAIEDYLFVLELQQVYPDEGRYWYNTWGYVIDDAKAAEIKAAGKVEADPGNPFTDVPKNVYYHDAVLWALEKGITTGTTATTFGPTETCTRGQVATFLWRSMGCPEPVTTENPFKDVKESDYFYKAVLWAYENGITTGTSETAFSPNGTCTSAHVVTFLWRANGKPAAQAEGTEYYAEAVAWANEKGLLEGVGASFKPENNSPRADIVTYLYRNAEG